jgi:shikimate dehydrogenase
MTRAACVIGWPIEHSRSPMIHGYWLQQYGIDGRYERRGVPPGQLAAFIAGLQEEGLAGCNVTVPHKEAVLDWVDDVHGPARSVGAANTLWIDGGRVQATNTDIDGFMRHLAVSVPDWHAAGGPALVLGAGGAARAVAFGLLQAGVDRVVVANRTVERAEIMARDFGPKVRSVDWSGMPLVARDATVVVNTTALGMQGEAPLDFDVAPLPPQCVVADVVYAPLVTPLLDAAARRGLRTVDGLGMLLHQAVPGFEKWFGVRPEVTTALRDLVVADLKRSSCC